MQYAYRVYKELNNPVFGGTVTAENMEKAAEKVINRCEVTVHHEEHPITGFADHYFTRKGFKVGILLYIRPEDY